MESPVLANGDAAWNPSTRIEEEQARLIDELLRDRGNLMLRDARADLLSGSGHAYRAVSVMSEHVESGMTGCILLRPHVERMMEACIPAEAHVLKGCIRAVGEAPLLDCFDSIPGSRAAAIVFPVVSEGIPLVVKLVVWTHVFSRDVSFGLDARVAASRAIVIATARNDEGYSGLIRQWVRLCEDARRNDPSVDAYARSLERLLVL